jgi:hypothetical protein
MLMRIKAPAFLAGIMLVLAAAGCGTGSGQTKTQSYGRDGLLGTTSANPNLPINPGYHDYASDVRMLKQSIGQIPGVTDSSIILNGPTAYVTLQLRDDIDIEQSMSIKSAAQANLQNLMPRYDVRVSVGKNHLYD